MALTPEQVKGVNQAALVDALNAKLMEKERDFKSLQTAASLKNAQVIKLEAEVVRIKMLRTDEQLRGEVDGLREQVSKKDRKVVRLLKVIERLEGDEKVTILRARQGERRLETFQTTLETMQHARDVAQEERDRMVGEAAKLLKEATKAAELAPGLSGVVEYLNKILEQAVKAVRALPPISRALKEVRVLAVLLKEEFEPVEEKKEEVPK